MAHALILDQENNEIVASVKSITPEQLPEGNVTVDVEWSSINYKDALAITGKGKIIRNFPMVPGIDFSGKVRQSEDPRFKAGQSVILTGWGVGENHWGGLSQLARVKGDWLVPTPDNFDNRRAMIVGTAGFTAMLCVMALQDGNVKPQDGEIIVTGASGGVGNTAIVLLNALGYQVAAVTGRLENSDYLLQLGAKRIISREEYSDAGRPLEKQLWAGAVDTVGGPMLAKVLAQMNYNATVAACGLAGSHELITTVMPFILRNVRLQGVDSVMTPTEKRLNAWAQLTKLLPESYYHQVTKEISLEQVPQTTKDLMDNKITGRTLVKVS